MMIKKLFFLFPFLFIACAVSQEEKAGPVYCTIDLTETYSVGTDPAADFDSTNIIKDVTFNQVDCPRVNNWPYKVYISRVRKVGNSLSIYENQYQPGQYLLEFTTSGTNVNDLKRHVNASGCSIIREWNGTLDSPGTTVTIHETITYKGSCSHTFYDPNKDYSSPSE